jgi:signal transduction histidine kinase
VSKATLPHTRQARNRPSIGFSRHRRFVSEDQPTLAAFAQVLAHRVRGLLTGIEGYTDLLLETFESRDQRQLAFRILESTSRIEGILKDLQHFNDPVDARFHKVPATEIVSELLPVLADSEINRLRIDIRVPEDISLRADEILLRQCLLAIVRNAFEAGSDDASSIGLTLTEIPRKKEVVFKIYNPTPLRNADIRRHMFEPFFTTKAANLGLGLTLARRIAEIHDGSVAITSSTDEEGTEISLKLPLL